MTKDTATTKMHIFESYDKEEAERFFIEKKPDIYRLYTYKNIENFKTVYVVEWFKIEVTG